MIFLRLFYNLLFPVVLVIMLPSFILRMVRRGNYRHKFGQRFGIYSKRVTDKLGSHPWTVIHAVSVGEVMIALKLIEQMRVHEPGLRVVLSTTTSTGYRLAHRHKSALLEPIYHPLDIPGVVQHSLRVTNAQRLILVEAEIWPNMMAVAGKLGIPRFLVNARLSPRSEKRYKLVRPLASAMFNELEALCVQEHADMTRWESLGVKPRRLHLTGSIKFDPALTTPQNKPRDFQPVLRDFGIPAGTPVLLGGSTFEGEEILLAETARTLRKDFPDLLLILVPRHAERCQKVFADLTTKGHQTALRSEVAPPARPEILLVNTTGELRDWYACATVVFIGKSLTAKGGQNPAEAITAGKPVLFGPEMQNFASLARQMLDAGGAFCVKNADELLDQCHRLLNDEGARCKMTLAASACLDVHTGATERTAQIINSFNR